MEVREDFRDVEKRYNDIPTKADVEKVKRKIEGDLKLTQETVEELERTKAELNHSIQRKEKEASSITAKIDDESTLASKYSKQAKELHGRIEDLEEELSIERTNRSKADKSRALLKKDLEDLNSRLEEAGSNTAIQVELNKKREGELARLKKELEDYNIAHENTLSAQRMKHNNTMSELGEQIDNLNSSKLKSEKDKCKMEMDLQDCRGGLEEAVRGKAEVDRNGKFLQTSIIESSQKLDELARALNEADSHKRRLEVEKSDLERQIEEGENSIAALNKNKISLSTQLEDTKRLGDGEARDRASLLSKYKALTTDVSY